MKKIIVIVIITIIILSLTSCKYEPKPKTDLEFKKEYKAIVILNDIKEEYKITFYEIYNETIKLYYNKKLIIVTSIDNVIIYFNENE